MMAVGAQAWKKKTVRARVYTVYTSDKKQNSQYKTWCLNQINEKKKKFDDSV